jgi:hypothetical protein
MSSRRTEVRDKFWDDSPLSEVGKSRRMALSSSEEGRPLSLAATGVPFGNSGRATRSRRNFHGACIRRPANQRAFRKSVGATRSADRSSVTVGGGTTNYAGANTYGAAPSSISAPRFSSLTAVRWQAISSTMVCSAMPRAAPSPSPVPTSPLSGAVAESSSRAAAR